MLCHLLEISGSEKLTAHHFSQQSADGVLSKRVATTANILPSISQRIRFIKEQAPALGSTNSLSDLRACVAEKLPFQLQTCTQAQPIVVIQH